MAQRFFSINLQDTEFPMLSEQKGRTIIGSTAGEAPAKENRPGIAYCHNVMPSDYGMDSVGFISTIPSSTTLDGQPFKEVRIIYGDKKSRIYFGLDAHAHGLALIPGATTWKTLPVTSPATGSPGFNLDDVTIGTVNGVSYIYYKGIGAFNYTETTNKLTAVTLTGINISTTLGIVDSSGYLIAYTDQAIAWSSTLSPTDFTPSQITGAGGGNVADLAGAILFITSNTLGILIYTEANVIAGTYTGNVQFPFKFREIANSKGGINRDRIAYAANSTEQYVYSKGGLQTVTSQRAETILPEVTDFLAGKRFEDYNETTKLYVITDLAAGATMQKKVRYIASRYLIISYGISSFTHALVLDTALNKLGKIKLDHVDIFEYVEPKEEVSKESIAFLLSNGEVRLLDFSTKGSSSGVIILGKLQFVRSRLFELLGVELENIETASTLSVSSQAALDGKTFTSVEGIVRESVNNMREFAFRSTAKNHSLVFIGKFNLVTVQVRYATAGRR